MTPENIKTMDPFMLSSLINTKLRNEFKSLNDLCSHFSLDKKELLERLSQFGYEYYGEINQFR
ncbi:MULTISPECIES: DUF4250 domain-containing protein [Youngiibacter]|jgi:hypothetical protein|uniref:DUF4250 domain-containing protein n=2 Tax=Youngiibacter TaxID=1408818 RepID=V7I5F5_9CLOT|nr:MULTISPECIES: DUF4250 domain-containing protein [Youngiibacter]ETA81480.1 hypothetical protein T472_0206220 [Youngiibacter fragilis 232.1]MBP1918915.1 hypothetical protein [Youngiibacter multivorans]MBW8381086.1 DUF4250 domain-containing protein [Youngiibacter sp.]